MREQLLAISPATIDRMLRPTKDARYPAAKSATRPGAALRSSIGVRQAMDEMEQAPGFFEIDLVAHSGHTLKGEHAWTLTATDVFLGWTENVTICNRAQAPGALCPHQPRGVDPQRQPDPAVADRLSQRQDPGLERPGCLNRTGSSGPASRDRVSPSRNGTVTASCGVCDAPLPTGRQRLWCSDACRQSAWRRRHTTTVAPVEMSAARSRREQPVYECPECETRLLGEQRCQDCATFMRRLGSGALCPCSGEPITINELLNG